MVQIPVLSDGILLRAGEKLRKSLQGAAQISTDNRKDISTPYHDNHVSLHFAGDHQTKCQDYYSKIIHFSYHRDYGPVIAITMLDICNTFVINSKM